MTEFLYFGEYPAREWTHKIAIAWAKRFKVPVSAFAPKLASFRNIDLPKEFEKVTPRTLQNGKRLRSVVIALWPTAEMLEITNPSLGLLVIPWLEVDLDNWLKTIPAVNLINWPDNDWTSLTSQAGPMNPNDPEEVAKRFSELLGKERTPEEETEFFIAKRQLEMFYPPNIDPL